MAANGWIKKRKLENTQIQYALSLNIKRHIQKKHIYYYFML